MRSKSEPVSVCVCVWWGGEEGGKKGGERREGGGEGIDGE